MSIDSSFIEQYFEQALPVLEDYISIPARSPFFDPQWQEHGHLARAAQLLADWVMAQQLPGATVRIDQPAGLTPLLVVDVPASEPSNSRGSVVIYGHLDKQPEMEPWSAGLGPWTPVRRGDRLFGRGAADDGYALFAAVIALAAIGKSGGRHARCLIVIEASEESASTDLPHHLSALADDLHGADLVIALDSFCETYDRLWTSTSTRGVWDGVLEIDVCRSDPHSGRAAGVLPSAWRIGRLLLDRLEDTTTGTVSIASANVPIPLHRISEAEVAATAMAPLWSTFEPVPGLSPVSPTATEELLHGTWRPALEVIGVDGTPPIAEAGNVFRSRLALKLSLRLPPTADVDAVADEIDALLTTDPPYGAQVRLHHGARGPGWDSPAFAPWLEEALDIASLRHFGQTRASCGIGGSIPFMGLLGQLIPGAQFVLVGVLGPGSNAHGPDEFLDLPTTRRLTACLADIVMAHADAVPAEHADSMERADGS
jgi:acetylornithine deacetylase/succinyl-diaminopimelate desuccinylase-like protein